MEIKRNNKSAVLGNLILDLFFGSHFSVFKKSYKVLSKCNSINVLWLLSFMKCWVMFCKDFTQVLIFKNIGSFFLTKSMPHNTQHSGCIIYVDHKTTSQEAPVLQIFI